jgi:putative PIN family toxin of toxin-antitoxin system
MSHRPRFVFDTNVLVSALMFSRSTPRLAWNKARQAGTILVSTETLRELGAVLHRPKIVAYVSPPESAAFLEELARQAELVTVTKRLAVSTDPTDDKFLELALEGRAEYLVTGDRSHLLPIGTHEGTRIVTPRELLDLL